MKFYYALAPLAASANQIMLSHPTSAIGQLLYTSEINGDAVLTNNNGKWCATLINFEVPESNDDWEYLQDKPVEKMCKAWRYCRMNNRRNEASCASVGSMQNPVYQYATFDVNNNFHTSSRVYAGHVCEPNASNCLREACECDLALAEKLIEYYQEQNAYDQEMVVADELPALEAEIQHEKTEQEILNEEVEEIVEDHAKLVDEHTQLVNDIAAFKHKVEEVVEEHSSNINA